MELFLLPFENTEKMHQMQHHLAQLNHLTSTQITPTFIACSTDDFFTLYHETDCRTILETLFYDSGYTNAYLYGTFLTKTPLIEMFLTHDVWSNIPFTKKGSFDQILPFLASQPLVQTTTLSLLDETSKQTLQYYFKNDLNVIQTAKQMYIHRNTLNYRLSHIHEQTGINPRSFYGAMYFFHILNSSLIS